MNSRFPQIPREGSEFSAGIYTAVAVLVGVIGAGISLTVAAAVAIRLFMLIVNL